MKGLKKVALVSAIAAASTAAQAELKALDDAMMGEMTGQAGLTIDINSADITIGEIQYKDAGSIFINNFKMGGAGLVELAAGAPVSALSHGTSINNLKINIDVAGSDAASQPVYGLNKVTDAGVIASVSYDQATKNAMGFATGTTNLTGAAAVAAAAADKDTFNDGFTVGNGDLVIGFDAQDQSTLVDLGFIVGAVVLGEDTAVAGNGAGLQLAGNNTVLMANTALAGAIGPVDVIIDGQNGGMYINAYFGLKGSIEMPFVATKFGFRLHNDRGADALTADVTTDAGAAYVLTGAHFRGKVEADADTSKGIHFVVEDFSGDMDITNITLGSAPSIGSLYITDMTVTADMNIYGH